MNCGVLRAGSLALIAVLAVAGCRSGPRDENQPTGQTAAAPTSAPAAAAQITPDRLASFVIQTNAGALPFQRTGPSTWEGTSPDSGEIVQWSQEDADSLSLVLYTENPRIRTLTVYSDDTASCSCFSDGIVVNATYQ